MPGSVSILSVGHGDTKLTFDPTKPEEAAKAAKVVASMIKNGFVLLVEVGQNEKGPIYQRAKAFDESTHEYIIAGMADDAPTTTENDQDEQASEAPPARKTEKRPRSRTPATRRVPASGTDVVAVRRTSGG